MNSDRHLLAWLAGALEPADQAAVEATLRLPATQARLAVLRAELNEQPEPSSWLFPPVGVGTEGMSATAIPVLGPMTVEVHLPSRTEPGCWLILAVGQEVRPVFPIFPSGSNARLPAQQPADLRIAVPSNTRRLVALLVPVDWLDASWEEVAVRLQEERPPRPSWVLPVRSG